MAIEIVVIGRDADDSERVETGLIDALVDVRTVYRQERSEQLRERWRGVPVKEAREITGLSRRQALYLLIGVSDIRNA